MQAGAEIPTASSEEVEAGRGGPSQSVVVPHRPSSRWGEWAVILVIVLLVCAIALLLAAPWFPPTDQEIAKRNLYLPLQEGQVITRVILDSQGKPTAWESENIISIPAWTLFGSSLPSNLVEQIVTLL